LKLSKDQPEAMAPSRKAACSMATLDRLRRLAGATAVITGGASGIGRALGEALARKGCEVVLADRQIDLASEVAGKIVENGGA
jgi:NADP-dependent 3-hydroxy acid dehydrogenase YdfG